MRRRAVITGIGVVCPLGISAEDLWEGLLAGRSVAVDVEIEGLGRLPAFPADDPVDPRERFGAREARRMDRVSRLAAAAALMAVEDAGALDLPPERVGTSVASVHGGAATLYEAHLTLAQRGADRVSPLTVPLSLANSAVATTARVLGLRGPSTAPSTACASGSDALGAALGMIREGRADAVVAGGADAPLSPVVVAGYRRLGALSRGARAPGAASRPFDRARDGFVIGEGAAVVVLEERERALARGAPIYAELAGYGSSCDAGHLTDPDGTGSGPARAIGAALADAALSPEAVGYVNAHATSTPAGDVAEARALRLAGLGAAPVSSSKGALGHGLGAAGALEAAITAMALRRGTLPPTLNLDDPEPEPELDHVREPRSADLSAAISNSFGFGGHNATLVLTRHDNGAGPAG